MSSNGSIWIEEYYDNPSLCVLFFAEPGGGETAAALTPAGAEVVIDLLSAWLEYRNKRMEEMYSDLENLGGSE
jgi:hypothetical protein